MSWLPRSLTIVPIDFSDDSWAALETARELAADPTHLHVIHVLPILEPNEPGVVWHVIDDEGRTKHADEALRTELRQRGFDQARPVIRIGDPGREIADYAQEVAAGLIVVSSHGKTGLTRLLIGSVAERVVRLARCPVLVLKK